LTAPVVVTGAGGQLGRALLEAFPDARGLTRAEWDVTFPPPPGLDADLVLHTAAWTDVDGAEDDPQSAAAVNVVPTRVNPPATISFGSGRKIKRVQDC